jgi:hypothetical protein
MVYYFTSNVVTPSAYVYVGKDKFESGLRLTDHHDLQNKLTFGLR